MDPSLTPRELIERQIAAHEEATRADYERVGDLTLQQRADLVDAVCSVAAAQVVAKRRKGIVTTHQHQWPDSTWDFLKRYAPNGRSQ